MLYNIGESGMKHPHFFCGGKSHPLSSIVMVLMLAYYGSTTYVQPVAMRGITVIKSGTLDEDAGNMPIAVERFKKYMGDFATPVPGALQAISMV